MRIIGRTEKGILVEIAYAEICELADCPIYDHYKTNEMFAEMWIKIKENYKKFNDLNYYVDKVSNIVETIKKPE